MQGAGSSARTHVTILGCIVAATLALRFAPPSWLGMAPGCALHTLLHLNCPFCGMTRDFTAMLHGQPPRLNPFSPLAVVAVYVVYPALFLWARSARRLDLFHTRSMYRCLASALVVMFVVNNLPR